MARKRGVLPKCVKPWTKHWWVLITGPVGSNFAVCQLEFCPHCGIFVWRGVHDGSRDYQGRLLRHHALNAHFWKDKHGNPD